MSFEIRSAKPSSLAVTRRPRPDGAGAVHQFQWHATRGAVGMDRQVSATENWFAHPSNDRGGWGSSADYVIGPDYRVGGRIVIVQFGDPFETYGSWSAGYGGRGENTIGAAKVGIAIEVAQPAGIDLTGAYTGARNATFEGFTPETIEACAWLVNEINRQLDERAGAEPIPAVHIESWGQHKPIPRGHIGHEDLANGVKLGKHDPGHLFPYDDILTLSDGSSRPPQNELIETMENMANRANAVAAAAHEMAADATEIVTRLKSADQRR